jgi:hypothetical protein
MAGRGGLGEAVAFGEADAELVAQRSATACGIAAPPPLIERRLERSKLL